MTKESLMAMGLTEEQATKVMEGLNGSFVTKTRFNEVNEELKTAKATITERDGQLNALKTSGADAAAKDKAHAEEIQKIKMDNALEKALTDAKAINPATVKPLLTAFMEKATLDDDGTIRGLADEIGKLAKTEGTSFLFKADDTAQQTTTISGASPAGSTSVNPTTKAGTYETRLADARKAGNSALAVAIKREAAADGVELY